MISIGVKELLDSGVHFGHQTKRWNPKMKPFIFDARNGIHIIDLSENPHATRSGVRIPGRDRPQRRQGDFRGHQKTGAACVKETAKECGQFYVVERWLGGTMTNFNTIKTLHQTAQGD